MTLAFSTVAVCLTLFGTLRQSKTGPCHSLKQALWSKNTKSRYLVVMSVCTHSGGHLGAQGGDGSEAALGRSMERSQRMLFLLVVCLVMVLVGYGLYLHQQHKGKAPSELKKGVQVLTDPESVVRDLEK